MLGYTLGVGDSIENLAKVEVNDTYWSSPTPVLCLEEYTLHGTVA